MHKAAEETGGDRQLLRNQLQFLKLQAGWLKPYLIHPDITHIAEVRLGVGRIYLPE